MTLIKLVMKSIKNESVEINIDSNLKVDDIRKKLVEKKICTDTDNVKIIYKGSILDLNKQINYYPTINDNETLVYLVSKKKISKKKSESKLNTDQPVASEQQSVASEQQPVATEQQLIATEQQPAGTERDSLSMMYSGLNINSLRELVLSTALSRMMTNPQILLQTISNDPQIQMLRSINSEEFDSIILNPTFLNLSSMTSNNSIPLRISTRESSTRPAEQGSFLGSVEDNSRETFSRSEPITFPVLNNQGNSNENNINNPFRTLEIQINDEDKKFIDEIMVIIPSISVNEAVQVYLSCNKDKNATMDILLRMTNEQVGS